MNEFLRLLPPGLIGLFLLVMAILWFFVPIAIFACWRHLAMIRAIIVELNPDIAAEIANPPPPATGFDRFMVQLGQDK